MVKHHAATYHGEPLLTLIPPQSVHFLENPLIQDIFDLSFDTDHVPLTSTERRLQETYVGKARAKELSGARGKRNVVTYDDYDDY